MQTLIETKSISVTLNTFKVLHDLSISIKKGERIGLVGANGAGKSTLLKTLAGIISPDIGIVKKDPQTDIGYLPQITRSDVRADQKRSGGENTKLILSKLFSKQHNLYLLDEPTNNLDYEGLEWLEKEILKPANKSMAFVIVSHDRNFLDKTINKIIEIDELTRTARQFTCSYSEYREMKKAEIENQWQRYDESIEEKNRLKKSTTQKSEWIRKIEKKRADNRKLPPKVVKPDAAYLRDLEGAMGRRVKIMQKRLDKMTEKISTLPKPSDAPPINLSFDKTERSGENVFALKNICFSYDSKTQILDDVNFEVKYGERIHITGKNGSGKTTLVKILLGELQPTSGDLYIGTRVHIGYLQQDDAGRFDKNIIDYVCEILGIVRNDEQEGILRKTLKYFNFEDSDAKKTLRQLSSGEYSRLQLFLIKMMKPNCIILDEPTNHLDIEAVEALEKGLKDFPGTLIVVSHDKRFMEEIGLNREWKL